MPIQSVQRLVEQQAAVHGERTAILTEREAVPYRELNHRANAVARHLIAAGFRRGGYAVVRMPRGIDLAVVLLAILKAGGAYTWFEAAAGSDGYPPGVSIRMGARGADEHFMHVDVSRVLAQRALPNPNLPIVTRGSDIACVLPHNDGSPAVLVPHGTIATLADRYRLDAGQWDGDAAAIDLWLGLMKGATVTLHARPAAVAAA